MSSSLQQVDKLTIQIIVDNSIEWFTKLPPGFTHELPYHLQHSPKIDEKTGVPIMDLDNFCCGAHGLSILLTTEKAGSAYSLIFDTGPDSRAFERNFASLGVVKRTKIDRIVLSHWHRDHSGGLTALLQTLAAQSPRSANNIVTVDLHPDRPIARGIARPPDYKVSVRLPEDPTFTDLEGAGGRIELNREGHVVGDGAVWVSGEIPRVTEFEIGLPGAMRWYEEPSGKGEWREEAHIMDERYVAVDVLGKGLIIFSACSHAGIVNVVCDAIAKFSRPIYMIMGGLHLAGSDMAPRIPLTVDFLSRQLRPAPTYIVPLHCSGFQAKIALEAAFGEGCVPTGVGSMIEINGDPRAEEHILPPNIS